MKKKILIGLASIAFINIMSVTLIRTAHADPPIDPEALCAQWCVTSQTSCTLYYGFHGGTGSINCQNRLWP